MKLRSFQKELADCSVGSDNVLIQADTGSGKTPVLADISRRNSYVLFVAHRNLLIKQGSKILATFGIIHDVLATKHTKRLCLLEHRKNGIGDQFIGKSNKYVCSIDSLLSRHRRGLLTLDRSMPWVIIVDEAHHMIRDNKWGRLAEIFPSSRIIGATATPCRLDGATLARSGDGVFDRLIQAEELRENSVRSLIEKGYLSDFKCFSIESRINESLLKVGTHDYTYRSLETETRSVLYEMTGDAVKHYQRLANGKQAMVFCASIEIAADTADYFKQSNISAAAIHSKMTTVETTRIFDLFERRVIQVLCNVDMIGEGVDVPAVEALIMMRKTASFGMYRQWIGRALRPAAGKDHAIIIDHVGNSQTHDLPDKHIEWSLENPPEAAKSCLVPCPKCHYLIKAWEQICPECGTSLQFSSDEAKPSEVKYIDHDLVEVMRQKIDREKVEAAALKELQENLQISKLNTNNMSAITRSVHGLKLWAAGVLSDSGISTYEVNRYFEACSTNDYWVSRFKLSDKVQNNSEKVKKVYKQWLS